ncbi:MAG: TetR/AcrR family transcriptional regulator, partial [Steroidobacteraceae bacterium]
PLGRAIWLDTARRALIEEGTAGVEINKLAKRMGVSRGGFYWFFKNRHQLLDELLALWAESSNGLFEGVLRSGEHNGMQELGAINRLWIDENEYDPKWDGAVRDWACTSTAVLKVVERVDNERIAILERVFQDLGYAGMDAHIRARVMYYHQVGYYALGIRESRKRRLELLPYYLKALSGFASGEKDSILRIENDDLHLVGGSWP